MRQEKLPNFTLKFPDNPKIEENALDFMKKTLEKNANIRMDI